MIKLEKILLAKFVRDYFPGIFGEFLKNFKINRKPWENNFGEIS